MPPKKIILFTSKGGHGHMAACDMLARCLSPPHEVRTVKPLEQLYGRYDVVRRLSGGRTDGEGMYNALLRRGWIRLSNRLYRTFAPPYIMAEAGNLERATLAFLEWERPDLLVSVVPFINLPAGRAARRFGIPFLVVTTDYDLTNWVWGLDRLDHPRFHVTASARWAGGLRQLGEKGIPEGRIHAIGQPLRPEFAAPRDRGAIRREWEIPADRLVLLMVMGGAGSARARRLVGRILAMRGIRAHLLACAGRSREFAAGLAAMEQGPDVSMRVIPFTDRMADLMAASDLLVTKPGPGTINEAVQMRLPMLVEGGRNWLFWEQANIDLVRQLGLGDVFDAPDDLPGLIRRHAEHPEHGAAMRAAMERHAESGFDARIRELVEALLAPEPPAAANFFAGGH